MTSAQDKLPSSPVFVGLHHAISWLIAARTRGRRIEPEAGATPETEPSDLRRKVREGQPTPTTFWVTDYSILQSFRAAKAPALSFFCTNMFLLAAIGYMIYLIYDI